MRKLLISTIVAATAAGAAPAIAEEGQDNRRVQARKACTSADRCREPRRVFPWYYRGQDEGAQVRRVRRISLTTGAI